MPYNGYSEKERNAKGRARAQLLRNGVIPAHPSDCMLCGDPDVPVEGHSEDYSEPYLWEPPALYWLCHHCHRGKLHRRFLKPSLWHAYLEHIRRGGYARDLKDPEIGKEFESFHTAQKRGNPGTLRQLRDRPGLRAEEWWDTLTMDAASLTDSRARPRA
jgi:hypothetical protein